MQIPSQDACCIPLGGVCFSGNNPEVARVELKMHLQVLSDRHRAAAREPKLI